VSTARIERLTGLLEDEGLEMLIVGDLVRPGDSGRADMVNLRWLTGFTGTSGLALVGPGKRAFVTDFRYAERVAREIGGPLEIEVVRAEQQLLPALAERLEGRIGYDDDRTSVRSFRRLEEERPEGVELVPARGLVERLRRRKDAGELRAIADAARLADEAYAAVLAEGLTGRSEREVARSAEAKIRELGGEPSFPPIVAAGENGALPHAEASDRRIGAGELVVFDMGAELDGYCSDCTRTFATGELDGEAREAYELVAEAQRSALAAVGPGVSGRDADAVARDLIAAAGRGEEFGHGTGHGVGMEVHEAPRLSHRSEDTLEPGDVVTVEPGVYVAGRFGIRIEDLVAITEDGFRNLSGLPKEFQVVD
jgi:Xaa-Pro aminopeptidase